MADNDHNTRVPRPAHNYVPEYQQSGIPFVKEVTIPNGGLVDVNFDFVTRWIIVKSAEGNSEVRLGFNKEAEKGVNATAWYSLLGNKNQTSEDGSAPADFTRLAVETPRLEVKCKKISLKGIQDDKVYIIAGLTNIRSLDFPDQTAANGFTGVE